MEVGLAKGVWYNGLNALITGAGIVLTATASGAVLWLGWAMVALGALQFIWGITHGGEHWWRRERIGVTWPYALMLVAVLLFVIGAIAAWSMTNKANTSLAPIQASAPLALKKAVAETLSAVRQTSEPIQYPASTVPKTRAAANVNRASLQPTIQSLDVPPPTIPGRATITNVRFEPDPIDPNHRKMVVSVTNAGPGVAYAGTASAAIVFGDGKSEYPQVDIEKRLAEIISSAASRHLTKQVADEPGKSFDREIEATVLDKDWVKVVRGEADAYYWQHMLT